MSVSMTKHSEYWTKLVEGTSEEVTVFSHPLSDRELKMGVE